MDHKLITIVGPTASGKTGLATSLANACNGAILSADSRQVYQKMDIGTGKDLQEYTIEGNNIPYYLIDICAPGDRYNINRYYQDFSSSLNEVIIKGQQPILCGGSGLYVQTAIEGNELATIPVNESLRSELLKLSKAELFEQYQKIDSAVQSKLSGSSDKKKIRAIEIASYLKSHSWPEKRQKEITPIVFGIDIPVDQRRGRITQRLKQRLEEGMIEEVADLRKSLSADELRYYGLEYLHITNYLEGQTSFEELFQLLETGIHQFAKRQMTWFRKMEKEGYHIHWLPFDMDRGEAVDFVLGQL